jgi:hypothetical protein
MGSAVAKILCFDVSKSSCLTAPKITFVIYPHKIKPRDVMFLDLRGRKISFSAALTKSLKWGGTAPGLAFLGCGDSLFKLHAF